MTPDDAVSAAVALSGVTIDPAWHSSVLTNFNAIAAAANLVLAFPLDDMAEYAPVFSP